MISLYKLTVENTFSTASGNLDAIQTFSFLNFALIFDHIFSIGFKSGL